jgi:transforming growth factor-beta-induced protein
VLLITAMVHITCLIVVLTLLSIILSDVAVCQNLTSFEEILASDPNLSALNAIIKSTGLNISAVYPDPITLFAPNNQAVISSNQILSKYLDRQYVLHVQNFLKMHVIDGEVLSTSLMDGDNLTALNMETINVTIANSSVTLSTIYSDANVVKPDILSSDGVLHQINDVLLPAFIGNDLLSLARSIEGFTILKELLELTGLTEFVGSETTATIFAPTDSAFMALGKETLEYYRSNVDVATKLLTGHVITPQVIPTYNMEVGPLPYGTQAQTSLTVSIEEAAADTKVYYINNATITIADKLAANGVIHAIDEVLFVPGTEYPPITMPTSPAATTTSQAPALLHKALMTTIILGWFVAVLRILI